jgi:GT2 family glycosyltransferase
MAQLRSGSGSKAPLVSVLIVTRNRQASLSNALHSSVSQDYPNIEIVVIDNASTDGTVEMVRRDFPRIQLITENRNLGCPSARNLGIMKCRGEFIYLLDDDGELEKDAISQAMRRAESDPCLGVVLSVRKEADETGIHILPGLYPVYIASFIGCCALLRVTALRQVGLFPDDFFRQAEEDDLAIRMLDAGWYIFLEPRSVMHHARSVIGRNQTEFDFFSIRNTTKTALRLWPFPYNIAKIVINLSHGIRIFLIKGDFRNFIRLVQEFATDLIQLREKRRPVRLHTIRLFLRLQNHPSEVSPG